jgi:magnesium-transporting ATPase (P-type)
MIPISLIISLGITENFQGLFMSADACPNVFARPGSISLNEEVGINFIFSDKTGTLT